jgi:soluble cytochrome b562
VEADVFISLACMKTHNTAVVTLGMKNLVGISAGSVYGVQDWANHWQLHLEAQAVGDTNLGGVITDLNSARRINLTIIDGRVAMEGEGPHEGTPVDLGLLIVGKNPVATDTIASTIMGFDAKKIPSLVLSAQKGLGTNDLHQIEVKGLSLEEVFHPFVPATGHESFLVISGTLLLLYRWRTLLFVPAIIFVSVTVMLFFFFRRSKPELSPTSAMSLTAVQAMTKGSQTNLPREEKKVTPISEISSKQLEDQINDNTTSFQRYVKQIDEMSVRLDEVTKLLKNGEIPQNAFDLIAGDLGKQLSVSVEDLFNLRENLELTRSKAMIEKAKNMETQKKESTTKEPVPTLPKAEDLRYVRGYKDVVESQFWAETGSGQTAYSPDLGKWEGLILKINSALSSLPVEKELTIIEKYLSFTTQNPSLAAESGQTEKSLSICRQRLATVSEKWTSIRRGLIEQIVNLEADIASSKDQIKELETRFSVGEITQPFYEYENNKLQNNLAKLQNRVSEIRGNMDDMDRVIFRSTEILQSGTQK